MKQTISVSSDRISQIKIIHLFEPLRRFMSYIGGVNLTTSEALKLTYFSLSFSVMLILGMTENILLYSLTIVNFIASCRTIKNEKGGSL